MAVRRQKVNDGLPQTAPGAHLCSAADCVKSSPAGVTRAVPGLTVPGRRPLA